jgi:alkylation response protein AidB-like acyl-CoA dehydrogenase
MPHEWLKRPAEMGYLGINLETAYGGAGASLLNIAAALVGRRFDQRR